MANQRIRENGNYFSLHAKHKFLKLRNTLKNICLNKKIYDKFISDLYDEHGTIFRYILEDSLEKFWITLNILPFLLNGGNLDKSSYEKQLDAKKFKNSEKKKN